MTKSKTPQTLEQQIQSKIDELNYLREKQRKLENQKKIIVGSLVIKECENNPDFAEQVLDIIAKASDRDKKKLESLTTELAKTAKQTPAPEPETATPETTPEPEQEPPAEQDTPEIAPEPEPEPEPEPAPAPKPQRIAIKSHEISELLRNL